MTVQMADRTSDNQHFWVNSPGAAPGGPPTFRNPGGVVVPPGRPRSPVATAAGEALYLVIGFPVALFFFVATVVLASVGAGLAILWIGVPLLVAALLVARFGAYLQLGLFESLTGRSLAFGGPRQLRPTRGALGSMARVVVDGGSWRALLFWLIKMVLAPVQFGLTIGLYAYGLGTITYPAWRPLLPAQQAADGSWHRGSSFGNDLFIDTWPAMAVFAASGVLVLMLAVPVVRAVAAIDRGLLAALVVGRRDRVAHFR